jgi:hypothetical protein
MRKFLCMVNILIWVSLSWQGLVLAQDHREAPCLIKRGLATNDPQQMGELSERDRARLRWQLRQQRIKRDYQEKRLKQRSLQEIETMSR